MTSKISYVSEASLGTGQKEDTLLFPQVEGKQDTISDVSRQLSLGNFITALVNRISSTYKVIQLSFGINTGQLQYFLGYTVT